MSKRIGEIRVGNIYQIIERLVEYVSGGCFLWGGFGSLHYLDTEDYVVSYLYVNDCDEAEQKIKHFKTAYEAVVFYLGKVGSNVTINACLDLSARERLGFCDPEGTGITECSKIEYHVYPTYKTEPIIHD